MKKFCVAVELGCGKGHITRHLSSENIEMIYQCDSSPKMLEKSKISEDIQTFKMIVDEEYLPFAENSVDVFVSSLNFHWINDLPSVFEQIQRALKPDGVLIASMFGGETLFELRSSLQLAETEREGGFSPHISPFARIRDIGDLLTRAGYTMLTIVALCIQYYDNLLSLMRKFCDLTKLPFLFCKTDTDEIKVNYPTMFELLEDLRGMGETNAAWNRKPCIHRDSLLAASAIYRDMYGNEDRTIPATFEIIYLIGWKPHESQAKPAKRGSGKISMKTISNLENVKGGTIE
ncbi:arginine-hydroxylase NDUFAF5, mitochondrial [Nephila pilipes]|uniref:Arginine-hydroxylase NDUFAF5, mitochondrial n=1 Tax=Nephila pilipes TaxID=299642 RepID=A0A8X6TBD4_NEPPI|nr:arginine-hydroxylase NDUFAF5, mitochondrial [Nephila pilipes]